MLAVLVAKCDVIALELPTDHRSVGCNLGAQVIGRSRGGLTPKSTTSSMAGASRLPTPGENDFPSAPPLRQLRIHARS